MFVWSKIKFVKKRFTSENSIFTQKFDFTKTLFLPCKIYTKSRIWPKKLQFYPKTRIIHKNSNFTQKNSNYTQKLEFYPKLEFDTKTRILPGNSNFIQKLEFYPKTPFSPCKIYLKTLQKRSMFTQKFYQKIDFNFQALYSQSHW